LLLTAEVSEQTRMAKILIVDDEKSILFATRDYLTTCGHEVHAADALDTALALIARSPYDLVIADLRLSGSLSYDGLELFDALRLTSPETPFVFLTAYGSGVVEQRLVQRGVRAVIHKPTPLADIAKLASELTGRRR
jgi:CheY-like chemotaxis protein